MRLYQQQNSGNCYKARLMLALAGAEFEIVDVNPLDGSTRTDEFLGINPNGKVPALQLADGRTLSESNAIVLYLADLADSAGSAGNNVRWIPKDKWRQAKMYEWLFWEQYTHEPAIAVRRAVLLYDLPATDKKMQILLDNGEQALLLMDRHLQTSDFLTGADPTAADLSLYAYTHLAEQGGYDLEKYQAVCAWLARVRNLPGHVDMDWRPS